MIQMSNCARRKFDFLASKEQIVPVLLFLSVSLFMGCDINSDIRMQYEAEKNYDRCVRKFQRVMINPTLARIEDYGEARKRFVMFLVRYEGKREIESVAELCKKSYLALAQLALLQVDLNEAVSWYERGLAVFHDDDKFRIEVNLALASAYQQRLDLKLAAQAYQRALSEDKFEEFLLSNPELISVPLKMSRLEKLSKADTVISDIYRRSDEYYKKIVEGKNNSKLTILAMFQLADSYVDRKRWNSCLELIEKAGELFPNHEKVEEGYLIIGKIYAEVMKNTSSARSYYQKVINESHVENLQARAHFELGILLFKEQKDEEGRQKMRSIIEDFPGEGRLTAKAQFAIAYSYEKAGKWDRALVEYRWLMDTYPLTLEGLYSPLHTANHFNEIGERDLAAQMYLEARKKYYGIIAKYPKTQLASIARGYLALGYALNEDWDSALLSAEQLHRNYKSIPQIAMGSQLLLGQLYEKNGSIREAINIYAEFLARFAGHPIAEQVKERMSDLKKSGPRD